MKKDNINVNYKDGTSNTKIIMIYGLGGLIAFVYSYFYFVNLDINFYTLLIVLVFTIIVLASNCYFSINDSIDDYSKEIDLYSYVELNGRAILSSILGLSILLFVLSNTKTKNNISFKKIIVPLIVSFICAGLILTIVWMPKGQGKYIRYLREIKTAFLTFSVSNTIISMIELITDVI
tara:strand:- start:5466 stop:5999 length:534 start_codon:yes stop_codon:yes gene_type:complete